MKFINGDFIKNFGLEERDRENSQVSPATWIDLVIYIFGGIGIYFGASLIVGIFITEFTIWTTVGIAALNFLCLAGSTYFFGVLRGKISWESMGLVWSSKIIRLALVGVVVAVLILPLRFGAAIFLI